MYRVLSLCLGGLLKAPGVAQARSPQPSAPMLMAPALEGSLNLNTASEAELMLLPGVGPATAAKVIAYRERHEFRRPSHLMRIKGVGKKTFARLRPYLTVSGENTLRIAYQ